MYFDPGTGSMIIQMLLGAIPVIAAFFIGIWKKIFKKNEDKGNASDEAVISESKKKDDFEEIDDE